MPEASGFCFRFSIRAPSGRGARFGLHFSLVLSSLSLPAKFKYATAGQASLLHEEAFEMNFGFVEDQKLLQRIEKGWLDPGAWDSSGRI